MEKTGRVRLKLSPEVSEIDRSAGIVTGDYKHRFPGLKQEKLIQPLSLWTVKPLL